MWRRRLCTVRRLLGLLLLTCTINITWIFLYLKETAPVSRDEVNISGRLLGLNNVTETTRPSTPDVQYLNMLNRLPIEPRGLRITGENNSVAKMIRDKIRNLLSPRQNMVLFSEFEANFERCNLSRLPDKHCFGTTPVKHHRTCAVVGSSGILLNSSCGNEIDSHDYVIRFNLVPLIKHARDAGMKSNLTVMNVYRLRIMVKRMELGSRRAWERFERINNSMIIYPKKLSRTAYQYRRYSELLELFRNRSRTATKKKRKVYLPLLYSITEVRNITTESVVYKYLSPSRNFIEFSFYDDTLARCEEESTLLSLCEGPTPIGRYRSCAVVGHGASVSTGGCEEAINKHDFVIRCSLPPNKERNTNTKQLTNLTIVDFETLKKLDSNTLRRNLNLNLNSPLLLSKPQQLQTFVIGYIGDFEPYEFGSGKVKHKMCSDVNAVLQAQNRQAMLTFSMEPLTDITRRILLEFNIRLPEPPSATLVSVLLALSFCDTVTLYGNTTSGDIGNPNEQLPNLIHSV
ncbi:PREDICTED: uncharacterized protein LOC109468333 [Branchiostoma belcheri]|uniref:Uncharacterized protein LOC109468333 n=1 Tax=Branchiostoma belcheri TaxID=7741 RepID=A0A6P4XZT0_BRABE|nr:PREDICTED: uncharacterized protein LOC109468333 [Branchiostoma belcheri]